MMMDYPLSQIDDSKLSLYNTPLGKVVQQEYVKMVLNKKKPKTARQLYIYQMNDCLSCITQSFWDIDLTVKLIEFAHPQIKSFKMTRVQKGDYLKYHFENYIFRLPKLKDQVVNLLNVTYQFGYSQSNGLERKIRKEKCIVDKKLFYFLDYFDDVFANIKPLRDTIAHRGELSDNNLALIKAHELVPFDEEWYNNLVRGLIIYTYIMNKNQGILKKAVITLLLMLNDDFTEVLNSLSPAPKKRSKLGKRG